MNAGAGLLLFQYCPKLAVFSSDGESILLCCRKGEQDYDGAFSLIGGKMEHGDKDIPAALRREKAEEVGEQFRVRVLPYFSIDTYVSKRDGSKMVLPHFYAEHLSGDVVLNEEYSDFQWVPLRSLDAFEPKISNISWIVPMLRKVRAIVRPEDLLEI